MRDWHDVGLGYSIASGRLFAPMADLHRFAEELMGRPVWTHEFADPDVWTQLRAQLEDIVTQEMNP